MCTIFLRWNFRPADWFFRLPQQYWTINVENGSPSFEKKRPNGHMSLISRQLLFRPRWKPIEISEFSLFQPLDGSLNYVATFFLSLRSQKKIKNVSGANHCFVRSVSNATKWTPTTNHKRTLCVGWSWLIVLLIVGVRTTTEWLTTKCCVTSALNWMADFRLSSIIVIAEFS